MSSSSSERTLFNPDFDFEGAITQTQETGYYFAADALSELSRLALETEINSLKLEYADHAKKPINAGKTIQVRQQHERFYTAYGDIETSEANMVIDGLVKAVRTTKYSEALAAWQPNEIGYQRYYANSGFIDPHRDRASDRLLSVTFTLGGSAAVKIFETMGDPHDYTQLRETDTFTTTPASVMLLRAPGYGSGMQTIHQVLPPAHSERTILNLRMRPTILAQPSHSH